MDTGSIARPASISPLNAPQRTDTHPASGVVKTELPPEAAVQQVHEVEAVRFEPSEGARERAALDQALRETIRRRIEIEPKTREVVYQTVDEATGEVLRQIPDEALLRLRAYAREMRESADGSDVRRVERIA